MCTERWVCNKVIYSWKRCSSRWFDFYYLKYSGLRPNFSKCGIAGVGSLKGVEVEVCGIKCVNLKVNAIKILGIHFSYNNKLNMAK